MCYNTIMKSMEDTKKQVEQYGVDAVIIITKKYKLNPFDMNVRNAMIEMFQQGAVIAIEVATEIQAEERRLIQENSELPF